MVDGEPVNGTNEAMPPRTSPPAGSGQEPVLCRDDVNSVITGVAAGLGRYTGVDPVVWRTAFAVTALASGTGLWLYIAAWLMMRDARGGPAMLEQLLNRRLIGPAVLALLGAGLMAGVALSLVGGFGWGTLVLAVPLILGGLVAHNRGVDLAQTARDLPGWLRAGEPPPTAPRPDPAPTYYNPAQPWAAAPHGPIDLAVVGRQAADRPVADDAREERDGRRGPSDGSRAAPPLRDRSGGTASSPVCGRRGVRLLVLALWGALLLTGALFALVGGVSLPALVSPETGPIYLGGVVALFGAALIVGSRVGDPRGLVGTAALVTLLAVASVTVDLTQMRFGEVVWRPVAAAEAPHRFDLTGGHALLDLSALPLEPGQEARVDARVGFGWIDVLVPDSARVVVRGTTGIGQIQLDGGPPHTGVRLDLTDVLEPVPAAGSGADGAEEAARERPEPPTLIVDLASHTGYLGVRRVPS